MSEQISLQNIDMMLNNIALKLIDNNDLMKCLKFNSTDALSQPITEDQKYELINQDGDITNTRIFSQPFNNKVISDVRSELRIYYGLLKPENTILTNVYIGFDVVVHNALWRLDGDLQRPTKIIKELLLSLNNQQIGGIGKLYFYNDSSITLRYFNDNFTGYSFTMRNFSK